MTAFRLLSGVGSGAAVLLFLAGGVVRAADETPAPPAAAAPAAGPVCPTCQGEPVGAPCAACGLPACPIGRKLPKCKCLYTPALRPGACFGYFQTQWNRWEEVCPLPYQGVGLSDAPAPPTPLPAGGQKSTPKAGDKMPMPGSTTPPGMGAAPLPAVPVLPQPTVLNRGR